MENVVGFVSSTTEVAFAVDQGGCLVAWNPAAERLFGHKTSQVIGRRCWEVLAGRDVHGNDFCQKNCQLRRMALSGAPIHPCEMMFHDAVGGQVRDKVSLLAQGQTNSCDVLLIHLLCPVAARSQADHTGAWQVCTNNAQSRLTVREREVLALLADGKGTQAVAEVLGLSPATVRNHIQNCLHKLRVHSRLEAVVLGRRLGLIC